MPGLATGIFKKLLLVNKEWLAEGKQGAYLEAAVDSRVELSIAWT